MAARCLILPHKCELHVVQRTQDGLMMPYVDTHTARNDDGICLSRFTSRLLERQVLLDAFIILYIYSCRGTLEYKEAPRPAPLVANLSFKAHLHHL